MVAFPAPGFVFEDLYLACEGGIAELSGDFDNPTRLRYAFRNAPTEVHEECFDGEDPFRAEFAHFAECVREGREPIASGTEGMKSVGFALAVKESVRSREPVELKCSAGGAE
jgi:predicted dehydrogenase